ncbi:MAG: calcium/sodium antiporter [Clostridia bacterium]|jgi:cation:H+ antiporter|nr:calcium/sodium antiporter [Clostridia bacterium]MCI1999324.1 calcium/sodium antiporter [Clostridia bacterium]MCI2015174.1 calcium/sodium antiporter [Clostridia bacterium]
MENIIILGLFAAGLLLIIKGGDIFVDSARTIAEDLGIPKFIIGATIVSFATTLPELVVSLLAAINGDTQMAIGNAVGSVTANTGLIMSISVIFMPSAVRRRVYLPKSMILMASIIILWLLSMKGNLTTKNSLLLFILLFIFLWENIKSSTKETSKVSKKGKKNKAKKEFKQVLLFLVGAAAIMIGSELLVDNGIKIAKILNVPENVIALTMVAIGTSLPELVTTLTALAKKESSLSVGNIIGANIIDTVLILPLCSIVSGGNLPVSNENVVLDMPICAVEAAVMIIPMMFTGKFKKWQGILTLVIYVGYIYILCFA